ncbi:ATP-dependent nuclease [Cupriavidus alkaliphilus]|uniref:ATP-dependent nuclease n=1 Tax=Cupriavidus alkaliphilus TaxID=942866 RepID=UPI0016227E3E|nr:AAA family ATPase [Cupriavidus alkaliphilus]MBB3014027.1 putative ATP-dependent endonuclease of OLD family [Cupriavidus alkaliphilus]
MTTYGVTSGIAIVAARVRDFRSLANIEVELNDLTVLIGANNAGKTSFLDALFAAIGAGRKSLGVDDVRLATGESVAPKTREVIIDVLIRPVGADGKVIDSYPAGSYWTNLWGTVGIASDDALNDFTGIRTTLKWSDIRGEHVVERRFLKEWKAFADWTTAATQDRPIGAAALEPLALHYVDAKRDLEEELRKPGSFWRRLTEDLGLSAAEIEEMEQTLSGINEQILAKSEILKHLSANLAGLQSVVASDSGTVDVAPVARKLRDLSKGVDVSFNTAGAQSFPLARHGMGTRSLASLLVFRAYASWRNKKATEGGDNVHSVLALEEPESHLHPQAQRALFSHIRQVTGQRVVSTHSPYFAGQAPLEDLRLFFKSKGDTVVTKLDTSPLKPDDIRKLQDTVVDTRGDILFSRGVLLFEGQTEEQALPVYAARYWDATIHELGFCFVRVNGTDYFPFIWLLKGLQIPWYVFADGEPDPVSKLEASLKKANEPDASKCPNVVVLPGGNGFEAQLLAEGYLPEIEKAIDQTEGQVKYLDEYMATLDGKPKKKKVIRDYKSAGARERAAGDYLSESKTRMAKPVAEAISALPDPTRRFPKNIEQILSIIGTDNGLKKAEDAK